MLSNFRDIKDFPNGCMQMGFLLVAKLQTKIATFEVSRDTDILKATK